VQDISIILEHVDLLDTRDSGNVQLLQSSLELSVISLRRSLRLLDDFTSGSSFSACPLKRVIEWIEASSNCELGSRVYGMDCRDIEGPGYSTSTRRCICSIECLMFD